MDQGIIRTQGQTRETVPVDMASYDDYRATPYYQTREIGALRQALEQYTTDEQALRQRAEAQYNPTYQAELEALRHQTEGQTQGYENQLAALGGEYDRQRRRANEDFDASLDRLNNVLLKRGMGRSSLVATQGAYMEKQRGQALEDIGREERDAVNAINQRIALLTDQAAQSRKRLAENYAQQLESRIGDMRRENLSASAGLQAQIAALQQQGYQAYQDWLLKNRAQTLDEMEFEARYGGRKSSSGSSSSRRTGASAKQSAGAAEEKQSGAEGTRSPLQGAMDYAGKVVGALRTRLRALAESAAARQKQAGASTPVAWERGNPSQSRKVLG